MGVPRPCAAGTWCTPLARRAGAGSQGVVERRKAALSARSFLRSPSVQLRAAPEPAGTAGFGAAAPGAAAQPGLPAAARLSAPRTAPDAHRWLRRGPRAARAQHPLCGQGEGEQRPARTPGTRAPALPPSKASALLTAERGDIPARVVGEARPQEQW